MSLTKPHTCVQVILGTKNSARKTREVSFSVLVTVAQKVCVCVALGAKINKKASY